MKSKNHLKISLKPLIWQVTHYMRENKTNLSMKKWLSHVYRIMYHISQNTYKSKETQTKNLNSSSIFILTDFFVGLKSHLKSYSTQKDITWKLLYEAQESSSNIKVPKSLLTDRQNIHIMQKPNLQVT